MRATIRSIDFSALKIGIIILKIGVFIRIYYNIASASAKFVCDFSSHLLPRAIILQMKEFKKVAILCDWLTEIGGAEKVLQSVHEIFPNAPIYTSQYRAKKAGFKTADVRTGWLNLFPRCLRKFISPLRFFYFSRLDLSEYDLVISIVNAESKGVKTRSDAIHTAYLQGPPTQYYWGLYDQYLENPGFGKLSFLARFGLKLLIKPMRKKDFNSAQKPDFLVANSTYVADEIKKYYDREAEILFPPVDIENIAKLVSKIAENDTKRIRKELFDDEDFFVIAGRQASWKRVDLAIWACIELNENLLVIGDGAEHERLVKMANGSPNIKFLPKYNGASEIVKYFTSARGFIFPSLEPFGITPVESLAARCPVIALKKGGALDFVKDGKNGIFFDTQNVDDLVKSIEKFKKMKFDPKTVSNSANDFSKVKFQKQFESMIEKLTAKKAKDE